MAAGDSERRAVQDRAGHRCHRGGVAGEGLTDLPAGDQAPDPHRSVVAAGDGNTRATQDQAPGEPQYGRFPWGPFELPGEAVEFVARQVQVPASELDAYEWNGRTVEYHRAQIRGYLGFRECGVADADKLTAWLAEHVGCKERRPEQVRVELLARCRTESIARWGARDRSSGCPLERR